MEICIKWNICRICLKEEPRNNIEHADGSSDQMRLLFKDDKKLVLHIYELFGVFMKPDDSLPDKICRKCISIINNAIQLRKTCRSSNNYLKSVLDRTRNATNLFKPVIITSEFSADESEDDKIELDSEEFEVKHSTLLDKQKLRTNEDLQNIESFEYIEHEEKQIEQTLSNMSSTSVELEEIIEVSEGIEDFTQIIGDDSIENAKKDNIEVPNNIKYTKPETTQLRSSVEYSNICNNNSEILESDETETIHLKESAGQLYHIIKDFKNESSISNDNDEDLEHDEQQSVAEKDFEFISVEEDGIDQCEIEESIMLHLEEKIQDNENFAQVSSTVDTNDEIEYYEHNSNDSNLETDKEEECLEDQTLRNCDISSSKRSLKEVNDENSPANKHGKTVQCPTDKKTNLIIFPRRKLKRGFTKTSSHPGVKLCVCEICGNQFTNRNVMNVHMKVHFKEKNHQCEICFKRFITACNLQAHMRIHTGEKPFKCKYCPRRFNDRSSNLRHERTHTNEKPFQCTNCGKSFSLATTLQNHKMVHSNERSYRCEPCGKSFKLPHHLKTHQNTSLHRSMAQIGGKAEN